MHTPDKEQSGSVLHADRVHSRLKYQHCRCCNQQEGRPEQEALGQLQEPGGAVAVGAALLPVMQKALEVAAEHYM
jgi:hypothetical protein